MNITFLRTNKRQRLSCATCVQSIQSSINDPIMWKNQPEHGLPVKVHLVDGTPGTQALMSVDPTQEASKHDPLNMHLVELARSIETADRFVKANASNKLTVIVDQIKYLQSQAQKILHEAELDHQLHHAACNFQKVPGTLYHLYQRESGQRYLSMLAHEEWGSSCPHTYLGSYRLEYDMSWTPMDQVKSKAETLDLLNQVFNAQHALTDGHSATTSDRLPRKMSEGPTVTPADGNNDNVHSDGNPKIEQVFEPKSVLLNENSSSNQNHGLRNNED